MADYEEAPYALWLEGVVKTIFEEDPEKMVLCAAAKDGRTLTAYYECDATDKAVFCHHIYSDAMLDVVLNNIGMVKDALEEYEEEEEGM